jgi:hypothetical protein
MASTRIEVGGDSKRDGIPLPFLRRDLVWKWSAWLPRLASDKGRRVF